MYLFLERDGEGNSVLESTYQQWEIKGNAGWIKDL